MTNSEYLGNSPKGRKKSEVEIIAELEEQGFEGNGNLCQHCGTELMEKETQFGDDIWDDFMVEIQTVCPYCGNREVSYDG